MSLSAYDIFTRLSGFEDEVSSTASNPLDEVERRVDDDEEDEELVLSSVGSESYDGISLDSAVLQELERGHQPARIPPWSFADGEQTILSSDPSGTVIPPPEVSQDIFALTPHPHFIADGIRSISTTSTEYIRDGMDVTQSTAYAASKSLSGLSLSLSSINTGNSGSDETTTIAALLRKGHETAVYERIASQLLGSDAVSSTISEEAPAHWYNYLISESDWDQFRVAANAILGILEPKPSTRLLPLPPTPPKVAVRSSSLTSRVKYFAQDHLPSDFICGLCKDVIVGACTLDCQCSCSIVCAGCFEMCKEGSSEEAKQDVSDQMGFVWIEDMAKECPSCHGNVNAKIHCHALDVAILHIIRDLPDKDKKLDSLKQNYYSRLAAWRATVYDRNERCNQHLSAHYDELLARLIQEEENIFWSHREKENFSRNGFLFLGQAAVALVAATIASIGLNVISSSKR
jgi:hypothetical protein